MNIRGAISTITQRTRGLMTQQNGLGCNKRIKLLFDNNNSVIQLKYLGAINEIARFASSSHQLVPLQTATDLYLCTQSPFGCKENPTHLNHVLGARWEQRTFHTVTSRVGADLISVHRCESTKASPEPNKEPVLSRKDKLKRAITEYGSTVIVFHVGISLISLGTCYVLVSSGIDMGKLLSSLGFSGAVASNAGTFVTAYAIHKVFAPVRISITLGATPFIVRYLRNIGFLKKPKVQ